jgi:hypothetical protein
MTSSAHGSATPWGVEAWPAGAEDAHADPVEQELLAQETSGGPWTSSYDEAEDDWGPADDELVQPPIPWDRLDHSAAEGLSGRALILTTALAAGGCALLDLALTDGRMTFFFDLCFVVICLVGTMAVRRQDLFTAGVLPPLVFAAVIAIVAFVAPQAFESAPGVNRVFLSGLAGHAGGLVGGYAVALLAVAARMAASDERSYS